MKNAFQRVASFCLASSLAILLITAGTGCKKDNSTPITTSDNSYDQVNLVSDQSSSGAAHTDPNLVNPWGIAIGATGSIWISANHTGTSTIYDRAGVSLLSAISIPAPGHPTSGGAPTGVVYNGTSDFAIPLTGETSKFIFATEDGTIAAWSSAGLAIIVANRSADSAIYKGLTIATNGSANFIYAADFRNGRIDVFDHAFAHVTGTTFTDPAIPAGFAPFNIRNINGMLYVTYAKQKPDKIDDVSGAGNGYVNIFRPDGTLVGRFASQGSLNSPWGIAAAPSGFGLGSNVILIGNFGDGHINAFAQDGTSLGALKNTTKTAITIDGLWDITFPVNGQPAGDQNQLFFTAGPGDENHGLFGYLKLH